MKTLIAKKKKVEKFYNTDSDNAKKLKYERLALFKQHVDPDNQILEGKKATLLDEIVFKTVNTGVYHCLAATLKETCKVGRTTIAAFNKLLRETKQYIIARYSTNTCNFRGLVYIDTQHENFYENMKFLFGMDMLETDYYLLKIRGTNIHKDEIIVSDREKQEQVINEFATNQYQKEFFNHIHEMPYENFIKRNAYKIAMKLSNTKKSFDCAVKSLKNLVLDIKDGFKLETEQSIVSVFEGAYKKALNYDVPAAPKEECTYKKAPFYNWLDER